MTPPQVGAVRRQQKVEELCGTSIRALSGDAAWHLRGGRLFRERRGVPLPAPHLASPPQGAVEIYGVGVGLDLGVFYRRSQVIDLSVALRNEVFSEIVGMIARR